MDAKEGSDVFADRPEPMKDTDLDLYMLNRELDKTKTHVFMGKTAGFLGSLICNVNFVWTTDIETAAVSPTFFYWNPYFFLLLTKDQRKTVLMHELWHIARLHLVRLGEKNALIWNYACDIRINNDLENEGYVFDFPFKIWLDHDMDKGGRKTEEEIYEILLAQQAEMPVIGPWGATDTSDMYAPASKEDIQENVNAVVQAVHGAVMAGGVGNIPGEIEQLVKQFLAPIVPWEAVLFNFFNDMLDTDHSWRRPNRRHADIYLPSQVDDDDGRLDHLIYYLDVSGSITDAQVVRFNSEVKYIKEHFQPKKLTLVQFDTRITSVTEFLDEDLFEEIVVVGRGGTCLVCVRDHILKQKPTAAIVFSDMGVTPMVPLPSDMDIPLVWIVIGRGGSKPGFGKVIHIPG